MTFNKDKRYASLYLTDKFINIKAYSGYRLVMQDPEASDFFLEVDAPLEELGAAILHSIKQSRHIPLEELDKFIKEFELGREKWIRDTCLKYKIRNRNDLFKRTACCSIEGYSNFLTFKPSHHERGDAWSPTSGGEADYISIAADSPPEKIGEAMWQALRRCTGRRPAILDQIPEA